MTDADSHHPLVRLKARSRQLPAGSEKDLATILAMTMSMNTASTT